MACLQEPSQIITTVDADTVTKDNARKGIKIRGIADGKPAIVKVWDPKLDSESMHVGMMIALNKAKDMTNDTTTDYDCKMLTKTAEKGYAAVILHSESMDILPGLHFKDVSGLENVYNTPAIIRGVVAWVVSASFLMVVSERLQIKGK